MHVLLIPSWYKTRKEPHMGTFFEEQARALMKLGHQAGILYPAYIPPADLFSGPKEKDEVYVDRDLPTYCVFVQTKIPRSRKLNYNGFCRSVKKAFDAYAAQHGMPDLIHAHSVFYGGIAARYIADTCGIPLVITEHLTSFIMGTISNRYDRELAVKIFSGADAALIVSNNFKGDIEKELTLDPSVFRVVHNMVSDIFFEDFQVRTYDAGSEPFVLFTNSFLLPRKNHKLIFDAMKILADQQINVVLKVGGDGALMDSLGEYARSLGIADRVEFLGGLTRMDVKKHVRDSHAFILASFYETFGVVLIESLACGRPVITTDSGGPRDFINETNGLLVREFSPGKLADAVQHVAVHYADYDQLALSASCHAQFNERAIAGKLDAVYRDVLETFRSKKASG